MSNLKAAKVAIFDCHFTNFITNNNHVYVANFGDMAFKRSLKENAARYFHSVSFTFYSFNVNSSISAVSFNGLRIRFSSLCPLMEFAEKFQACSTCLRVWYAM